MSLSTEKLQQKRALLSKKGGSSSNTGNKTSPQQQEKIKKYIWKPEPGEQVVRVIPLQSCADFPFVELRWHYEYYDVNGNKNSYLSPSSINKPDPIVEYANRLQKGTDTWKEGKALLPKLRTYVPILVRGKEEEGPKFWGFGVQVYQQLMDIMEEFGDITDLNNGYDIKVIFKSAVDAGKDFPETKIVPKAKSRPVIDHDHPKAKEIMELIIQKQPDIFDIYKPATYDELVTALDIKLKNQQDGVEVGSSPRGAERTTSTYIKKSPSESLTDPEDNVKVPTEEEIETATVPIAEVSSLPNVSPSAQKAKVGSQDFKKAFADIFEKK